MTTPPLPILLLFLLFVLSPSAVAVAGTADPGVSATGDPETGVAAGAPHDAGGAALSGRVLDGDGEPVAGARVTVRLGAAWWPGGWAPELAGETRSGADGTFSLSGSLSGSLPGLPTVGALELRAEHPDFAPAVRREPALEPGERRSGVDLRLDPGRTAVLQVLGADGRGVAGARARLRPHARDGGRVGDPGWRVCDREGRCRFSHLGEGLLDVQAEAPGHARRMVPGVELVASGPGPADLGTVRLEEAVAIRGRVVDDRGRPVAGARIASVPSLPPPPDPWREPQVVATSGPDGGFRLEGLTPGRAVPLGVAAPPAHERVRVPPVEAPAEDVQVELPRSASVSGRVVDAAGEPVAAARVHRVHSPPGRAADGLRPISTTTGGDGRFRLEGIPPGEATLVVTVEPHRRVSADLELAPGEHRSDVVLAVSESPEVLLAGRVTDPEGAPVARATVTWRTRQADGGSGVSRAGTGPDGRFELAPEPAGSAGQLEVDHPEHRRRTLELTVSEETLPLDVVLEPGRSSRVEGRVVDGSGAPVVGAVVWLTGAGDGSGGPPALDRPSRDTLSVEEGRFSFAGVGAGCYLAGAAAEGFLPAVLEEPFVVGETPVDGLRLVLQAGGTVEGRVVGRGLDRFDEVRVRVRPVEVPPRFGQEPRMVPVDRQGRFRVTGLAPGLWELAAMRGGEEQGRRTVETAPGTEPPEVVLPVHRGHTLTGTVRSNGEPAVGERLQLQARSQAQLRTTSTGPDGRYRFPHLPEGEYRLEPSFGPGGVRFQLDGDLDLDLDLERAVLVVRVVDEAGDPVADGDFEVRCGGAPTPGSFRAGRIPPIPVGEGPCLLRFQSRGRLPVEATVDPVVGEETEVEVLLPSGRELVLDLGGDAPAVPVQVWWRHDGTLHLAAVERPGGDGRLAVSGVPEGPVRVVVVTPGRAAIWKQVEVPGPPVPVPLPPEARLVVRLPEEREGLPRSLYVRLLDSGGAPLWLPDSGGLDDRRYFSGARPVELENLPPGGWTLEVSREARDWRVPVVLVAGETTEVTLE